MDIRRIIKDKQTRLCFSADFNNSEELYYWINLLGPHICILKTHIDILDDFNEKVITELIRLKNKYNFLILEDRKFADIGKTFQKQLFGGIYKIASWADIITIHGITCLGMLKELDIQQQHNIKVLIVAQMSSSNNLISTEYTQKCYEIAQQFPNLVMGFISQKKFIDDINNDNFLFLTPGVKLSSKQEKDQNYRTPKQAICDDKNDIIIVGSGIYLNQDLNHSFNEIIDKYKTIF